MYSLLKLKQPSKTLVGTRRVKCCYGGEEQIPLCCQPTILVVSHCLLSCDLISFLSPVLFVEAQLSSGAVQLFHSRFSNFERAPCVHMKAVI